MINQERGFDNLKAQVDYDIRLMLEEAPEQTDKNDYVSFLEEHKKIVLQILHSIEVNVRVLEKSGFTDLAKNERENCEHYKELSAAIQKLLDEPKL